MRIRKVFLAKRNVLYGVAGLLVICLAGLELSNTAHLLHKTKVPGIIPAHTNNGSPISQTSPTSSQSAPNPTPSSTSKSQSQLAAGYSAHTLVTPSGDFVSNHFPGQNGSPTTEASFCNTSPGSTCYIKFTNVATGETAQLASQVTDARGTTSWYWDVSQDAHLTPGQWRVTAVATLGDQTKSANDTLNLTIR